MISKSKNFHFQVDDVRYTLSQSEAVVVHYSSVAIFFDLICIFFALESEMDRIKTVYIIMLNRLHQCFDFP